MAPAHFTPPAKCVGTPWFAGVSFRSKYMSLTHNELDVVLMANASSERFAVLSILLHRLRRFVSDNAVAAVDRPDRISMQRVFIGVASMRWTSRFGST
ncbi:bsr2008 [Bradyrhizobium diazoefficiens USDA 110]|uniref:Bsr2008 protein n=2 Tax=Bradyrhizobium TaxID=374 RepID=Q89TG8_BRADU|nr:hypothetical protein RN69_38080 [Bradyrhizobium japonicum]AND87562.1 hypothetical protein AAV28_06880 [Bradyrhizobium diazoefficiens USDA 110]APO50637.1 hypothetical protein BD122_10285 [Bradyrhizobium diazoefficiens]KGT79450.1 hypothetical protein MA20_12685 [Bradyrhizobium japonicum]KOY05794.1 hypothetical protein AF336_34670 [Bradyrhizobium diazoefficiens]